MNAISSSQLSDREFSKFDRSVWIDATRVADCSNGYSFVIMLRANRNYNRISKEKELRQQCLSSFFRCDC